MNAKQLCHQRGEFNELRKQLSQREYYSCVLSLMPDLFLCLGDATKQCSARQIVDEEARLHCLGDQYPRSLLKLLFDTLTLFNLQCLARRTGMLILAGDQSSLRVALGAWIPCVPDHSRKGSVYNVSPSVGIMYSAVAATWW
jgi:hypothetical protein